MVSNKLASYFLFYLDYVLTACICAACTGTMSLLLVLPDPCLLAVVQYCAADDICSVFSAARSHSKLHQAAVTALRSFKAQVPNQHHMDGVQQYLSKHGSDADSVDLERTTWKGVWSSQNRITLRQLPPNLQLSSLQLSLLDLQLQPGGGFQGVLGAAASVAALKQLSIHGDILDGAKAFLKTLSQLPASLQDLRFSSLDNASGYVCLPAGVLRHLQDLTTLSIGNITLQDPDELGSSLQAMTRLVDLRLYVFMNEISVKMLAGAPHLTRLDMDMNCIHPGGS
jgi:hypothetical protein